MNATPQRVCPHCATIGYTAAARCPFCRRSYRRHTLAAVAAMLVVTGLLVLAGMYAMFLVAARAAESELDRQVRAVQEDFDDRARGLERGVREELNRRLPTAPTAP